MAMMIPAPVGATGWGRNILDFVLSMEREETRERIAKEEGKRRDAVQKALGTHRAAELDIQFQNIELQQNRMQMESTKMGNLERQRADTEFKNAMSKIFNMSKQISELELNKIPDEGGPATDEMIVARARMNAATQAIQTGNRDFATLLDQQSFLGWDFPPKDAPMTKEELAKSILPSLISQLDAESIQGVVKSLTGVELPDSLKLRDKKGVKADWTPEQKAENKVLQKALSDGQIDLAQYITELQSVSDGKGISDTLKFAPGKAKPLSSLYALETRRLIQASGDYKAVAEFDAERMNALTPGKEFRAVDVNPGFGEDWIPMEYEQAKSKKSEQGKRSSIDLSVFKQHKEDDKEKGKNVTSGGFKH